MAMERQQAHGHSECNGGRSEVEIHAGLMPRPWMPPKAALKLLSLKLLEPGS